MQDIDMLGYEYCEAVFESTGLVTMRVGATASLGSAELVQTLAEKCRVNVLSIEPVKASRARILQDLRADLASAKQGMEKVGVLEGHPAALSAVRSLSHLQALAGSLRSPQEGVRVAGDVELVRMFEIVDTHIELLQQRGTEVSPDPPALRPGRRVACGASLAEAVRLTRGDLIPGYLEQLRAAAERAAGLAERSKKAADRAQYHALAHLVTKTADAMEEAWSPLH